MFKKSIAVLSVLLFAGIAFASAVPSTSPFILVPAAAPILVPIAASSAAVSTPGFFSAVTGFTAGLLLSWPALVLLIVLGLLFEHNGARGWAVFTALALMMISYFFFSVPLMTIGIGAAIYLLVGIIWSFWRYKLHANNIVERFKYASIQEKQRVISDLHPKAMLSTITAWIMIWPFSMVENVVGDLINAIQIFVSKIFRGVYHRIYNSAVSALIN